VDHLGLMAFLMGIGINHTTRATQTYFQPWPGQVVQSANAQAPLPAMHSRYNRLYPAHAGVRPIFHHPGDVLTHSGQTVRHQAIPYWPRPVDVGAQHAHRCRDRHVGAKLKLSTCADLKLTKFNHAEGSLLTKVSYFDWSKHNQRTSG
jgi:hypothetical protein